MIKRTTREREGRAIPSMLKERKGGREGRKEWICAYGLTPTRFFLESGGVFWSPEDTNFKKDLKICGVPHLLQLVHLNASTPLHLWVSSLHARKQNEEE